VLFNAPANDIAKWEVFQDKVQKSEKKYKGYKLSELIGTMPKLEDT
jgi:hypothetical protein